LKGRSIDSPSHARKPPNPTAIFSVEAGFHHTLLGMGLPGISKFKLQTKHLQNQHITPPARGSQDQVSFQVLYKVSMPPEHWLIRLNSQFLTGNSHILISHQAITQNGRAFL